MSQSDQVHDGGSPLLRVAAAIVLVIACLENLYLGFLGVIAAGFVGILIFLVPTCIGLAYLLFLWLRLRLANATWALLLAAIAAAVWPWTGLLGMGHLDHLWGGIGWLGFFAPYGILAVVGLYNWPHPPPTQEA